MDQDVVVGVGLGLGAGGQRLTGVLLEVRLDLRVGDGRTRGHRDPLVGQLLGDRVVGEVARPQQQPRGDQKDGGDNRATDG